MYVYYNVYCKKGPYNWQDDQHENFKTIVDEMYKVPM